MSGNSLIPSFGKISKGTTKYFLVALTEHNKNSVARVADLSTNVISTYVKNHSSNHLTQYISHNPKKVAKLMGSVAKLTLKK